MALIEIDGLPLNSMVIFHGYVSHNQMVTTNFSRTPMEERIGLQTSPSNQVSSLFTAWSLHKHDQQIGDLAPISFADP